MEMVRDEKNTDFYWIDFGGDNRIKKLTLAYFSSWRRSFYCDNSNSFKWTLGMCRRNSKEEKMRRILIFIGLLLAAITIPYFAGQLFCGGNISSVLGLWGIGFGTCLTIIFLSSILTKIIHKIWQLAEEIAGRKR